MAVLKIHSDIIDEETKQFQLSFFGVDSGISFNSIDEFVESITDEDKEIDIRLHCRGGSVSEGWAIYDKLRQSGKTLKATIEGKCASMASILLLAAPKENRTAYPNAQLLIHSPYIPEFTLAGAYTADDLQIIANDLKVEEDRILNTYIERTGADKEELIVLMKADKFISMEEAKRLGFISTIKPPVSAQYKSKTNKMAKKTNILDWLAKKAGYTSVADAKAEMTKTEEAVAMELDTADGSKITIEREEGTPQVGDTASPDGEHLMPDGSTIIVADGVITEIILAEGDAVTEALQARVTELEGELATANAKAKTSEDIKILNAVKMAGGTDKVFASFKSVYKPSARAESSKADGKVSKTSEKLQKLKEQGGSK